MSERDPDDLEPIEEVGEPFDVAGLHARVWREHDEPRDGAEPVPTWLSLVFGVVVFLGGFYVAEYDADFLPHVYDGTADLGDVDGEETATVPKTEEQLVSLGRRVYRTCVQCHQLDGRSQTPYPPLAGSEWVTGGKASTEALIEMTLYGVTGPMTVAGKEYDGTMPGYAGQLRDHEIAAVLTFIRKEWDNRGETIFPEAVSEVRRKWGVRGPFRVEELTGGM